MASFEEDQLVLTEEYGAMQSSEPHRCEDLQYIKDIARGGMSRISLFYLKKDGSRSKVVVKRLFQKFVTEREFKYLRVEIDILTRVDHANIIRTFGIVKIEQECGLVLEYLPNGSYTEFFDEFWDNKAKTKEVEEKIAPLKIRIIAEIISAMEYLHLPRKILSSKEKSILHLDLKGENVLLDKYLHAKVCDFGLSMMSTLTRLRTSTTIHRGVSGTPGFIAPERLQDAPSKPSTKCDVYSFGILEYSILTDSCPYPEHIVQDFKLLEHHIVQKKYRPDTSKIPPIFPDDLIKMMEESWSACPNSRPAFRELGKRVDAIILNIRDSDEQVTDCVNTMTSSSPHIWNRSSFGTPPDHLLLDEGVSSCDSKHENSHQTPTQSDDTVMNSDDLPDNEHQYISNSHHINCSTTHIKAPISHRQDQINENAYNDGEYASTREFPKYPPV